MLLILVETIAQVIGAVATCIAICGVVYVVWCCAFDLDDIEGNYDDE